MSKHNQVIITVTNTKVVQIFTQLLELGFFVDTPIGCNVRTFVSRHLGIDNRYLEERIQTIFLDHNPVDNFDTAVIGKDPVLDLSIFSPLRILENKPVTEMGLV